MVAYNQRCDQGWAAVLKRVQDKIEEVPLSSRVVGYYRERDEATVIRRIKRIVREEMKQAARMTINNESVSTTRAPNAESGGSLAVRRQMKYAKKRTPEERREAKLLEFADTDSDEDVEETQAAPPKKKTLRDATLEAQTAHKEMCEQAKSSMAIMNEVMKKLHNKLVEL